MEAHRGNETITRYRPPGVIPLELWDLWVNGRTLWETMNGGNFPDVLCGIIQKLRRGEGETRSEGPVPDVIKGFDSLFVSGRRSQEPPLFAALRGLDLPTIFTRTPDHPGSVQGLHLLGDFGGGWLCDLGQSALKICAASQSMKFGRDLQRLPIRVEGSMESIPLQRQQLRDWLSESLRIFSTRAEVPEAILFALPSRLDDAAVPESSSYIGMEEDGMLIHDVVKAAGVNPRRVMVMNDAELAALDALCEPQLQGRAKTLVITLGFGLGAALILRNPSKGTCHA